MDNWMEYQKTFYEVADRLYETNMQNISQQYDWDFVKGVIRSLNEFEYSLDPKKDITIFRIKHNNRAKTSFTILSGTMLYISMPKERNLIMYRD